jgi:hypothetical protein
MGVYSQFSPEQLVKMDRDTLLMAWHETSEELAMIKKREQELRLAAFGQSFPEPTEGVNNLSLGNGWLLKATHKLNYSIENSAEMRAALATIPDEPREALVKWSPKLSGSQWQHPFRAKFQPVLEPFVTIKPGMPDLKLLPPGAEGNKR